jgi:hypothetical protein
MTSHNVFEFEYGRARIQLPADVIVQNFLDSMLRETNASRAPAAPPRIGAHWPEQGGIYIGICPGQNGQPDYHLIAPADPRALLENVQWHSRRDEIADADSDWDGLTNTRSMADVGSELAGAILDLDIDGHRDFYLPARHEMSMVKLVAPDLIAEKWHWSSTQGSADDAWCQDFDGGYQDYDAKDGKLRARAVRRLLVIQ